MAAPRKYPDELRERAAWMAVEARQDPATRAGAIQRIGHQLGVHPEALRGWVRRAEVDEGARAGTSSEDAARIGELEREVRELRKANEILRAASAFSPRRASTANCSDRGLPRSVSRGLGPICRVLTEHGLRIAPVLLLRGQAARRGLRSRVDRALRGQHSVRAVGGERPVYGVRKLWHAAQRAGHTWRRDQVGRLTRLAGIIGAVRGRRTTKTTYRDRLAARSPSTPGCF